MKRDSITKQLLEDYYEIFNEEENLKDFNSYYKTLVQLIKKYPKDFSEKVKQRWGLTELLDLDLNKYIVDSPSICLKLEKNRLVRNYENIDTLAMTIRDTLWDMITIYSRKNCPITQSDESRYIKIIYNDDSEDILLECQGCGWTEYVNGDRYSGPVGKVIPANEEEIKNYVKSYQ